MEIRRATAADADAIASLYNHFVQHTLVSFETEPVDTAQMAERIKAKQATHEWLVGVDGEQLLGYAYYGEFRARAAYDGTVESSVYMAPEAVGRGAASALYTALLAAARAAGYREVIGVITLPNARSEALHRRLGFESVGVLRAVGRKFDQDADVALWQLHL